MGRVRHNAPNPNHVHEARRDSEKDDSVRTHVFTPAFTTQSPIQKFRSKKRPNSWSRKRVMQFLGTLARLLVSLGVCHILGCAQLR